MVRLLGGCYNSDCIQIPRPVLSHHPNTLWIVRRIELHSVQIDKQASKASLISHTFKSHKICRGNLLSSGVQTGCQKRLSSFALRLSFVDRLQ